MTKDECRMTKEARMSNEESREVEAASSRFGAWRNGGTAVLRRARVPGSGKMPLLLRWRFALRDSWSSGIPHSAFTLVELLVVIAIIGILAVLIFPAYQRVVQSGRAAACLSNLRQLGVGLNLYLGEHNMMMPTLNAARSDISENVPVIDNTLNRYLNEPRIFACPADSRGIAAKTGTSYYWNVALNGQPLASLRFLVIKEQTHIPILADKEGFHPYEKNKVNLLYADGHVTKELSFFTNK
jgi:prepilin-type N-terminal cleavage/methylation domain-containing protein/prepilin-type processing-associated H-X9-DG protein